MLELPICPPPGNIHLPPGTDWRKPLSWMTLIWVTPAFSSQRSSEAPFAPWFHFFTAENIAAKTLFLLQSKFIWHTKSWSRYNWQHTDSWMISTYLQLFFNCKEDSQHIAEHLLISTTALFLLLTLPTPPPLSSLTSIPKTHANCKLSVTCGVGFILCILMHFSKTSLKKGTSNPNSLWLLSKISKIYFEWQLLSLPRFLPETVLYIATTYRACELPQF